MFRRIRAIIFKEIHHILRDPRTLAIIFALPVFMVLIFGYALNMDIKNIKLGVMDRDNSPESRALLRKFYASEYFEIAATPQNRGETEQLIRSGKIKAALVIPEDFGETRANKPESAVQLLVDGSDPTFGNSAVNYATAVTFSYSVRSGARGNIQPVEVREKFLYNPDLKGSNFIIPGIVAVLLMMVCALLTSLTIAREKETGTMEMLLVSPVRPMEIIVGKVAPYIVMGVLDAVFILVFAKIVFGIPIHGDLWLLFGMGIIYVYCALGMGLLISSIAPTQQVAMMAAMVGTLLPSFVLSGFIFSIFSMPAPIRAITRIVPARYFIDIIRGILLKSSPAWVLKDEALTLAVIGTIFLAIATLRFKTRTK